VLLLVRCSNNLNNKDIPIIDIEKGLSSGKEVLLSKFCSSVDYIPLQTVNEAIIGSRPEIKVSNGLFIIKYLRGNNLIVFDSTGRFLNTIGILGNASNEYTSLEGFDADNKNRITDAMTFIMMSQISGSMKMKETASRLTENSNPVITVVTLK
jgi:hypothetical protein